MNPQQRLSAKLHRNVCMVLTEDTLLAEEILAQETRRRDRGPTLANGAVDTPREGASGPR